MELLLRLKKFNFIKIDALGLNAKCAFKFSLIQGGKGGTNAQKILCNWENTSWTKLKFWSNVSLAPKLNKGWLSREQPRLPHGTGSWDGTSNLDKLVYQIWWDWKGDIRNLKHFRDFLKPGKLWYLLRNTLAPSIVATYIHAFQAFMDFMKSNHSVHD